MDLPNKHKVLLVEDDSSISEMYRKKLTIEGIDVITAVNGGEGLQSALSNKPDLIVLDIMLPGIDGMSVMKKLRHDPWGKSVPIIILTNLNAGDDILRGVMEGHPAYYLMKSNTDPADLAEKVKEVLLPI